MKHIVATIFIFSILLLSSLKSTAQNFKFPPVQKPKSIAGMFKSDRGTGSLMTGKADLTKATEIASQDNYSIYELPLDKTRCLVSNNTSYQMPNTLSKTDASKLKKLFPIALK